MPTLFTTTVQQQLNSHVIKCLHSEDFSTRDGTGSPCHGSPGHRVSDLGRVGCVFDPVLSFNIVRLLFLQSNNISANKMIVVATCCRTRVLDLFRFGSHHRTAGLLTYMLIVLGTVEGCDVSRFDAILGFLTGN